MIPTVVVVADYAGTLVISDRQDVRPRWTQQAGAIGPGAVQVAPSGTNFGVDLANRPYAVSQATDKHWNFHLEFGPSLTLTDLTHQNFDTAFQVLYAGALGVEWHDREVRLALTENASYGKINSSYVFQPGAAPTEAPGQPTQPVNTLTQATGPQLVPAPVTITFLSSNSLLRLDDRTGKFTSFYLSAAFSISGGIDTPVLPQQYGPRFEAGFNIQASRRDSFVTLASAQRTYFTTQPCVDPVSGIQNPTTGPFCKPEVDILQLTEGVRHAFDRATTFELDVGASASQTEFNALSIGPVPGTSVTLSRVNRVTDTIYPAALATLTHVYPGRERLTFHADASYQPVTDYRSGVTNNRIQGDLSLADSLSRTVRVTVTARAAQTVPADQPLSATLAGGEADVDWAVLGGLRGRKIPPVELTLGVSAQWQNQVPYGSFFSVFGFLAVTAATPALRF